MSKHLFNIAIGDYLREGHGQCEYYSAVADKPIEDVLKAHTQIAEKTGIDLTSFATKCKDTLLPESVRQKLLELGYEFRCELYEDENGFHFLTADLRNSCPDELASIWVFLLNQVDPELHCSLVNELPVLFGEYGKPGIGYGLFQN